MRVALLISALTPGGAERVISILANAWAARGWSVDLLTFDDGREPPFYALHPAVVLHPLGIAGASAGALVGLGRNVWRARVLRAAVAALAPDVLISFLDRVNITALLATAGMRTPVIVSERNDPHHYLIGRSWELLRRLLYRRASAVVVQSQAARAYFAPAVQRRTRVLPNPVPPAPPDLPPAPAARPTVLAMGRLTEQKGFDLLLQAFAALAGHHPGWALEIWGEGEERPALEAQVRAYGLAERVQLPGVTRRPAAQMRRAELFVLSSRYEGFPNVLCEALACGLPVVSFDCPSGVREIVRDRVDGLLVPPGDVGALAAAMGALMADQAARRRLAARAPEVLDRFGVPQVAALWETLIGDVLR